MNTTDNKSLKVSHMKKIMFSDKYGLTEAVLSGRKTQTRRIICCPKNFKGEWVAGFNVHVRQSDGAILEYPKMYDADESEFENGYIMPKYKIGEEVGIAQNYKDAGFDPDMLQTAYVKGYGYADIEISKLPGWKNKMFTYPTMMPHRIRITNVRVERLQDISDDDCIKEGIIDMSKCGFRQFAFTKNSNIAIRVRNSPREAYAELIDKISGHGVWDSNPFVFVYDFELVK